MSAHEYSRALEAQLLTARTFAKVKEDPSDASAFGRRELGDLLDEVLLVLPTATPYYWSPALCALLVDLGRTIPGHWRLSPELLPTDGGFFWFADTVCQSVADDGKHKWAVRALAWRHMGEHLRTVSFSALQDTELLYPVDGFAWRVDRTLDDLRRAIGDDAEPFDVLLRSLASAFAVLDQTIVTYDAVRPDRAARRRFKAQSATPAAEPLVRVVQLRRVEHRGAARDAAHAPVEWSCQWIVRGHWRDQWYPKLGRHQPLWILPHVKGPEDMPLRPAATKLFAVVR